MFVLRYDFPLPSIPFYTFALHRRHKDRRRFETLACLTALVGS